MKIDTVKKIYLDEDEAVVITGKDAVQYRITFFVYTIESGAVMYYPRRIFLTGRVATRGLPTASTLATCPPAIRAIIESII